MFLVIQVEVNNFILFSIDLILTRIGLKQILDLFSEKLKNLNNTCHIFLYSSKYYLN